MNCPWCGGEDTVEKVAGVEPWSYDHLACRVCDSTFNEEDLVPGTEKG